jgi:predicted PhzF superfamily epimerase YddE/YHI9
MARASIEQGIEMGRPSRLDVEVEADTSTGPTHVIRAVRVGGRAVVVAEGTLLPDGR